MIETRRKNYIAAESLSYYFDRHLCNTVALHAVKGDGWVSGFTECDDLDCLKLVYSLEYI